MTKAVHLSKASAYLCLNEVSIARVTTRREQGITAVFYDYYYCLVLVSTYGHHYTTEELDLPRYL